MYMMSFTPVQIPCIVFDTTCVPGSYVSHSFCFPVCAERVRCEEHSSEVFLQDLHGGPHVQRVRVHVCSFAVGLLVQNCLGSGQSTQVIQHLTLRTRNGSLSCEDHSQLKMPWLYG